VNHVPHPTDILQAMAESPAREGLSLALLLASITSTMDLTVLNRDETRPANPHPATTEERK
jgi:hypothetical protein